MRRLGLGGLLMGLRDVGVRKRRPRRRRGSGVPGSEIGVRGSFGGAFAVGHRLAGMFDGRIHPSRIAILPPLPRSEGRRLNLRYRSDAFVSRKVAAPKRPGEGEVIYTSRSEISADINITMVHVIICKLRFGLYIF